MQDHQDHAEPGTEPPVELGIIPVIRPAVAIPNPDSNAPQVPAEPEAPSSPVELPTKGGRKKKLPFPKLPARKRLQLDSELPTQAIRMVDRLQDSPYRLKTDYKKVAEVAEVRSTLMLALKLGESLFRFGAGALEVETSIIVVTQAFGVRETEVDITNQSISLNYAPPGEVPHTYQRVVRSWSQNYSGLAQLHQLVTKISQGEVTQDEAIATLAEIRHANKRYPWWVTSIANGLFGACFVMFIGGGLVAAGLSLVTIMITMALVTGTGQLRVPEVFSTMVGGLVTTMIAMGLYSLEWFNNPSLIIAGGLMTLLPTLRFVSAVQDGINGFPVTSAGRLLSGMLSYVGLVSGITVAVIISESLGIPSLDITRVPGYTYPWWLMFILVGLASFFAAIPEQTSPVMLLPTAVVAMGGYGIYLAAEASGFGSLMAPAAAAVAIGFLARIVALRLGAPQIVIAVPGILFLLPGLMIFRSLYRIASESDSIAGSSSGLFMATIIILIIAMGSVLGDTLARPFTTGLQANERRLIGRR